MSPVDRMDPECIKLCAAMNRLPGIRTTGSCCGHGERPYMIFFDADFSKRGLLTLSRLMSHNYYGFWMHFRVVLGHQDVDPQVCFVLEGRPGSATFVMADELAKEINDLVDDRGYAYNILYDRRRGG